MLYKELDKIPLSRFIDVYLGNVNRVAEGGKYTRAEKEAAAEGLCNRYLSIVGGKSMLAQISRRNEVLKLQMRLSCLEACRRMMSCGAWDGVRDVLGTIGYRFRKEDRAQMKAKVDSVEASDRYRMDKLLNEEKAKEGKAVMDRTYFTKERVAVMGHVKMYIDADVFSAEEYAWMVRRMCEELDAAIRSTRKKK